MIEGHRRRLKLQLYSDAELDYLFNYADRHVLDGYRSRLVYGWQSKSQQRRWEAQMRYQMFRALDRLDYIRRRADKWLNAPLRHKQAHLPFPVWLDDNEDYERGIKQRL